MSREWFVYRGRTYRVVVVKEGVVYARLMGADGQRTHGLKLRVFTDMSACRYCCVVIKWSGNDPSNHRRQYVP